MHRNCRYTGLLVPGLLSALAISACSDPRGPATRPTSSSSATPAAHLAAVEVCEQFTVTALSSDTATDRSSRLHGEGREPAWPLLLQHRAHIEVTTSRIQDDPNPPGEAQIGVAVLATRTAIAADGWRQPLPEVAVYCALIPAGQTWTITNAEFVDAAGSATP